jgi:hypothetical protein
VYECYENNRDVGGLPPPNTAREKLERAFVPNLVWEGLLHPRRTLDQFYYSSLSDTATRDVDQTVSKWSGTEFDGDGSEGRAALEGTLSREPLNSNMILAAKLTYTPGRNAAVNNSLLIMVDQLWCWINDGGKEQRPDRASRMDHLTKDQRQYSHSSHQKMPNTHQTALMTFTPVSRTRPTSVGMFTTSMLSSQRKQPTTSSTRPTARLLIYSKFIGGW